MNEVEASMLAQFSRTLVQYYTALRLSAGAALSVFPFETPVSRAPIVRAAETTGPAGFDRREIIVVADRVSVVTMPLNPPQKPGAPQFNLN